MDIKTFIEETKANIAEAAAKVCHDWQYVCGRDGIYLKDFSVDDKGCLSEIQITSNITEARILDKRMAMKLAGAIQNGNGYYNCLRLSEANQEYITRMTEAVTEFEKFQ